MLAHIGTIRPDMTEADVRAGSEAARERKRIELGEGGDDPLRRAVSRSTDRTSLRARRRSAEWLNEAMGGAGLEPATPCL